MAEKKIILVVEENATNRKILCKILDDKYEMLEAENEVRAFEILRGKPQKIVLVLVDIVTSILSVRDF